MDAKQQAKAIFLEAVEKHAPDEWSAFLDGACAGQPELRQRVVNLLEAHREVATLAHQDDASANPAVHGATIGPYKLLELIGEGGMGTVWMAQQTEPVKRLVALKLIKSGMDTKQVIARFEAERQALALMDHPNIAKVLDGGTTGLASVEPSGRRVSEIEDTSGLRLDARQARGRPYFVMELVKGIPITKYCDEHRLTPRQRLELFVPVCHAIQHAHQKGIIHRDIKPSNVLIALYDDKPVPKVIDFGVAKATGQQLTEATLNTGFGAVVGTLEYMSPEQASFNQLDIDTRSDVYSLGVLLYELLSGVPPFTKMDLEKAGILEMLRVIREQEPSKPSTKLSTAEGLPTLAANRGTEPAKLTKLVRGELDWIVMKALEKDRNRRYETANGFAADVKRYLADEPVQACPPSVGYRLRKFVRRNRVAVTVVGVVAASLLFAVVGLMTSTALVWRALEREQQTSYWQRIALAEREGSANNLPRLERLLVACPERYRGWEWHYLKRLPGKTMDPLRHDGAVNCSAISPDGEQIVCADNDGAVKIWDAKAGASRLAFQAHDKTIIGLAYSPDSRHFATSDVDFGGRRKAVVKVWDARTGQLRATWESQWSRIDSPVFRADGLLAFTTRDATGPAMVVVIDPTTGNEVHRFDPGTKLVWHLASTPDGTQLAVTEGVDGMKVFDVQSGYLFCTLEGGGSGPRCSALSPDGRLLAVGYGSHWVSGVSKILVWELRTGRLRLRLFGQAVLSLAFHPDGSRLASGGMDNTVKLWDVATGHEILTLRRQFPWISGLAFTPDGHRLVVSGGKGTVFVLDGRPLREDEKIGQELFTLGGHRNTVSAVAFHPSEPWLVTASEDGVQAWDTRTGKVLRSFPVDLTWTSTVAFSPDGKRLAVGGMPPTVVTILDTATGDGVCRISGRGRGDEVMKVDFSPDGKVLAVAANDGAVFLHDAATGALLAQLPGHHRSIHDVAFHPDPASDLLASTDSSAATIRVWNTKTRTEVQNTKLTHNASAYCVAFSPDGRLLATGSMDRTIRVWDTTTWKQVNIWRDETGGVTSLAFSPTDGRLLVWGSMDSTVKVWNPRSGEVATLRGHADAVLNVAVSRDGTRIASGSVDGTARLWETPPLP